VFLCSYLDDSIGLVRAIHTHSFRPKMVGAGMIGPQNTAVKTTLGPLLNGFVNYEYWVPVPAMLFPGVEDMLSSYQAQDACVGTIDPSLCRVAMTWSTLRAAPERLLGECEALV
jgi:branched-chain amino acid transport system substrate-binding protein